MSKCLLISLLLLSFACNKNTGSPSSPSTPATSTVSTIDSNDPTKADVTVDTSSPIVIPVITHDPTVDQPAVVVPQTFTTEFMNLINDHRISIGLHALMHDEGLAKIVTQHSLDMASGAVAFGHSGFSSRCSSSRSVIGGGNWCGENVAMGQRTPQAAFTAWMNSPGHRDNIEQSRATHTGFGYAASSSGTYYWTQIFLEL